MDSETSPQKDIIKKRRRISEFTVDETAIKAGSEYMWLWAAIEQKNKQILALSISKKRSKFVAERFIEGLAKSHGKHPVSTDGGTWYPQACRFLKLNHHIHSPYEKSITERTIQHIKDRAECFDDCFPCSRKKGCNFLHIRNWLGLFATMHNKESLNA